MRKVLCLSVLLTSLSFAGISGVHADPLAQCKASTHKPISEIKIAWGTSYDSAYGQLKRQYGSKARILKKSDEEIEVNFHSRHRQIFDFMTYKFVTGKLTFVGISYSNGFQRKVGGILDAWKLLAKKLIDRYGEKADDVSMKDDTAIATWSAQPIYTELFGKDPNVLFLKTSCKPLQDQLEAKARESVNVGF
jgi:hypothetical protein